MAFRHDQFFSIAQGKQCLENLKFIPGRNRDTENRLLGPIGSCFEALRSLPCGGIPLPLGPNKGLRYRSFNSRGRKVKMGNKKI